MAAPLTLQLIVTGPGPGDLAVQTFDALDACLKEAGYCLARGAYGLHDIGDSVHLTITAVEA